MLVLARKPGERIRLGHGTTITVLQCTRGLVRFGIDAPTSVPVVRFEIKRRSRAGAVGRELPKKG